VSVSQKLSFEKSVSGRTGVDLGAPDFPSVDAAAALGGLVRTDAPMLPELSELECVRHFTELSRRNFGVDTAFYPLGSCTMKYNPKVNEAIAADPRFTRLHPLAAAPLSQGTLGMLWELGAWLSEMTGMSEFTLSPMAGAHGEMTGIMLIKACMAARGEAQKRDKILVPDSAHGTNPASAALCGYKVVSVQSDEAGLVDMKALDAACNETVAGIMLTNPNTLGLFETNICKIADLVHSRGGLLYYDGANLNAIVGRARPGDMGFDVAHLNLHKTFATPHGGGGPGAGPVGVSRELARFLPVPFIERRDGAFRMSEDRPESIGRIGAFYGNVAVCLKAHAYIAALGAAGLREASAAAVLNANYLRERLKKSYSLAHDRPCMHEFVLSGADLPGELTTMNVAKRLIDYGFHPPTVYFPLIVKDAIMIEPTETETPETLDDFAAAMEAVRREADESPGLLLDAPTSTPVTRLDEAMAAREADFCWRPDED